MKNLIAILTAVSVFATPSCINASSSSKVINGSGNIITESRTSEMQFTKIDVSSAIVLTIAERSDGDIIVRADNNFMPYVRLMATNGTLTVTTDKWYNFKGAKVEIEIPNNGRINEIELSGAAELVAEPTLSAYDFDLDISGSSKVRELDLKADNISIEARGASSAAINIEANDCEIEASGASQIRLEGMSRSCEVGLTGACQLNAKKFEVENYDIEASGASQADIFCTRSLEAGASGASAITYDGGCTIKELSRSGASKIFKR